MEMRLPLFRLSVIFANMHGVDTSRMDIENRYGRARNFDRYAPFFLPEISRGYRRINLR